MIVIGFTGTVLGMTHLQKLGVRELMMEIAPAEAHHGDCLGSDATFHLFCKLFSVYVVGHPGTDMYGRSPKRAYCDVDEWQPALPYLERNSNIVRASQILIATPKLMEEERRSGTWATIRRAREMEKELRIVYPDGSRGVA